MYRSTELCYYIKHVLKTIRYWGICYYFQQMTEIQDSEKKQRDVRKVSVTRSQCADSMRDLLPSASWPLGPVKTTADRSHMSHRAGTGSCFEWGVISLLTPLTPFIEQRKKIAREKLPTYSRREDKPKPQNTRQDPSNQPLWVLTDTAGLWVFCDRNRKRGSSSWTVNDSIVQKAHTTNRKVSVARLPVTEPMHRGENTPQLGRQTRPLAHSWAQDSWNTFLPLKANRYPADLNKQTPTLAFGT